MNAGTSNDFTIYFINVPANKLELWFWMESDRLRTPSSASSTPSATWCTRSAGCAPSRRRPASSTSSSTPCSGQSRPTAGRWSAGPATSKASRARRRTAYFAINYAPNNLTAALVGDFEPGAGRARSPRRYFGRLPRGPREPAPRADARDAAARREAHDRLRRDRPAGARPLPHGRRRPHGRLRARRPRRRCSTAGPAALQVARARAEDRRLRASASQTRPQVRGLLRAVAASPSRARRRRRSSRRSTRRSRSCRRSRSPARRAAEGEEPVSAANDFRGLQIELRADGAAAAARRQPRLGDHQRPTRRAIAGRDRRGHPARREHVLQAGEPHRRHLLHEEGRRAARRKTRCSPDSSEQEKAQVGRCARMLAQMKAEQVQRHPRSRSSSRTRRRRADKQKMFKAVKKLLEDRLKQLEGGDEVVMRNQQNAFGAARSHSSCSRARRPRFSRRRASRRAIPAHPRELKYTPLDLHAAEARHVPPRALERRGRLLVEDHDLPLVNVSTLVRTGSYLEPAGKEGLASLAGSQMRAGGTATMTAEQFDEAADFLAASISSSRRRDAGQRQPQLPRQGRRHGARALLRHAAARPRFQEDRLKLAKSQMLQAMERRNDNTDAHRGARVGPSDARRGALLDRSETTKASIESITREDLSPSTRSTSSPAASSSPSRATSRPTEMLAEARSGDARAGPSTKTAVPDGAEADVHAGRGRLHRPQGGRESGARQHRPHRRDARQPGRHTPSRS